MLKIETFAPCFDGFYKMVAASSEPTDSTMIRNLRLFCRVNDACIPTVCRSRESLSELRLLLTKWRSGEDVSQKIIDEFDVPPGVDV